MVALVLERRYNDTTGVVVESEEEKKRNRRCLPLACLFFVLFFAFLSVFVYTDDGWMWLGWLVACLFWLDGRVSLVGDDDDGWIVCSVFTQRPARGSLV